MEIAFTVSRTIKTGYRFRSYGQKDPLAEFRKEAFELFEICCSKVKTDTVKFLMNLKVVVIEKKSKNKIHSEKNKKFPEMHHVLVVQEKNINIVTEEVFKLFFNFSVFA